MSKSNRNRKTKAEEYKKNRKAILKSLNSTLMLFSLIPRD